MGGVSSQGGASDVFPFPKATWAMERVVLTPPSPHRAFCWLVRLHGKCQRAVPGRAQAKACMSSRSAGLTWQMRLEGNGKVIEAWDKGVDGANGTVR